MSLASYFPKKNNSIVVGISKRKSTDNDHDDNAGGGSPNTNSSNYNDNDKFSFQFFSNEPKSEWQRKNDTSGTFKFGFQLTNGDNDERSKRKRRKRKKKKKTNPTTSTMTTNETVDVEEHKKSENRSEKLELTELTEEGNGEKHENNGNCIPQSNKNKKRRKRKSRKKNLPSEIDSSDNAAEEDTKTENDDDEELNFQAMKSFIKTSKTLDTREKQNYKYQENKSKNDDQQKEQQKNDAKYHSKRRTTNGKAEGRGTEKISSHDVARMNTSNTSNSATKKNIQDRVITAALATHKKGKKKSNNINNKKMITIQRQAQLNSLQQKQSISQQKKPKTKAQDQVLKFNSSDKGKAMVNHSSFAVRGEKNKLLRQQQQSNNGHEQVLQKESNPFSFGFHFNSLLPQSPESDKNNRNI